MCCPHVQFGCHFLDNRRRESFQEYFGNPRDIYQYAIHFSTSHMLPILVKKDTYWRMCDAKTREQAKDAIHTMLHLIKNLWPRNKGQEWALPKFHKQLHISDDIARNGSPQGTNSGPTEHNHIEFVKNPSQQTQKLEPN